MKKVEGNWKTAIKLQVVMVPIMGLLSQVGVLLRQLDGLSWFLAWRLPSTCPTLCYKEFQDFSKDKDTSL